MADQDIHTIWRIFGPGGLIDKLGPDRTIRELKKRCDAGAIIGCSLYKLLIEKWIDVATGKKDPGERAPAEEFMQSAGEDALVKKIEELHVQYPDGIPRSIRIDVKDEWNADLERKMGRRIPLDPKDASKKDIEESKKIAETLATGVGLPRPSKPKYIPEKEEQKQPEPPRPAAPEEVPQRPLVVKKPEQLELMKKEIEERINAEKKRRARGGGGIAGESAIEYPIKKLMPTISDRPLSERVKAARAISATAAGPSRPTAHPICPEIPGFLPCKTCRFKYSVQSISTCPLRPEPTRFFKESSGIYSEWTYDDFRAVINQITNIENLTDLANNIEESGVMTPGDKVSARQLIEKRKRDIIAGTPEIRRQIEEQKKAGQLARAEFIREDDIKKDDDVMQEPRDYTQWAFPDFEGLIPGIEDIDDLEELYEYIDASDKLSEDEAETLRNIINTRIEALTKGYVGLAGS